MRKIIHCDCDCFYASVETRDNKALQFLPVAVGGSSTGRGVITTCNYIARKYGVRSAMPTVTAFRLCPKLILLPVNMQKYRIASNQIKAIFLEFTNKVESVSLFFFTKKPNTLARFFLLIFFIHSTNNYWNFLNYF